MDSKIVIAVVVLAVAGLGLLGASGRAKRKAREAARLAAVERKLDLVMRHLGIEEPAPAQDPDVVGHLVKGEMIQAIKLYRDHTGVGLAEAKDAVERIARERGLR
jgi:ribosomal protein L7/L12